MNKLFLLIILIILQSSCGLKTENPEVIAEQNLRELKELESIIIKNNIPNLIVQYKEGQKQDFLLAIDSAIHQISRLRNIDSKKLSITGYIKPKDLIGNITAYNYNNSDIVESGFIPEKILNSFNKDFKCPKPDKNSPIKRSTTLVFNKKEADLRVAIEELK
jgi:hypothetical protein